MKTIQTFESYTERTSEEKALFILKQLYTAMISKIKKIAEDNNWEPTSIGSLFRTDDMFGAVRIVDWFTDKNLLKAIREHNIKSISEFKRAIFEVHIEYEFDWEEGGLKEKNESEMTNIIQPLVDIFQKEFSNSKINVVQYRTQKGMFGNPSSRKFFNYGIDINIPLPDLNEEMFNTMKNINN